jgi:hypothetical protein
LKGWGLQCESIISYREKNNNLVWYFIWQSIWFSFTLCRYFESYNHVVSLIVWYLIWKSIWFSCAFPFTYVEGLSHLAWPMWIHFLLLRQKKKRRRRRRKITSLVQWIKKISSTHWSTLSIIFLQYIDNWFCSIYFFLDWNF